MNSEDPLVELEELAQPLPVTICVRQARPLDNVHFDAYIMPVADDLTFDVELIDLPPTPMYLRYSGRGRSNPRHDSQERDVRLALESEEVQSALHSIRDGVKAVLEPLGFGAIIQVSNLIIHDVDFTTIACKWYTSRYLKNALRAAD
ncbi:MAG: hypothetical protein JWL77_3674 [Chthonomonadaceae bacterium]|nr:hypothetical protein [Chthonomonadaceae bacterium]